MIVTSLWKPDSRVEGGSSRGFCHTGADGLRRFGRHEERDRKRKGEYYLSVIMTVVVVVESRWGGALYHRMLG